MPEALRINALDNELRNASARGKAIQRCTGPGYEIMNDGRVTSSEMETTRAVGSAVGKRHIAEDRAVVGGSLFITMKGVMPRDDVGAMLVA